LVIGFVVLATCLACRKDSGPDGSHGGKDGKSMRAQYEAGMAQKKQEEKQRPKRPPEPPPAPKFPVVKMPASLEGTCLVKVGGSIPEAELANLEGKKVALRSLFGKKLTVLLFWQSENLYATQALELLELDVAKPFAEKGVRVVGISVKDSPEAARKAVAEPGVKYPNLVDPKGEFFAKVATEKIPRVYLLDSAGKVLWLDIEYSSSTRRDLEQAIKLTLGEK
jgi:peroxiredoxin